MPKAMSFVDFQMLIGQVIRTLAGSTSGYCFLLASGVISWGSKKQQSVALSSVELEYMALAKASAEAIWLRKLLHELGFPQANPTIIYSNSQSAIALSENPKFHSRSKHVDTQYHFTKEKVLTQEIQLQYVQTANMTVDIFTKSLPKDKHYHCMSLLGMDLIPPSPTLAPSKITALLTYTKPHYSSLLCGSISAMSLFHFINFWSGRLYQPLTCILFKTSQSAQYFTDKTHLPQMDKHAFAEKHYTKLFFSFLVEYFCSRSVVAMVWQIMDVVMTRCTIRGTTNPTASKYREQCRREPKSDIMESAQIEIALRFSDAVETQARAQRWIQEEAQEMR